MSIGRAHTFGALRSKARAWRSTASTSSSLRVLPPLASHLPSLPARLKASPIAWWMRRSSAGATPPRGTILALPPYLDGFGGGGSGGGGGGGGGPSGSSLGGGTGGSIGAVGAGAGAGGAIGAEGSSFSLYSKLTWNEYSLPMPSTVILSMLPEPGPISSVTVPRGSSAFLTSSSITVTRSCGPSQRSDIWSGGGGGHSGLRLFWMVVVETESMGSPSDLRSSKVTYGSDMLEPIRVSASGSPYARTPLMESSIRAADPERDDAWTTVHTGCVQPRRVSLHSLQDETVTASLFG